MAKLWNDQEGLRTLVAGLLRTVKSDDEKIAEAVRFGILQAQEEQVLRAEFPGIDTGFARALRQRAAHKGVSPHVLPDRDPMARFLNGIVASGKDGRR